MGEPAQQEVGALHADLVLWDDTQRHICAVREALQDKRAPADTVAHWRAFLARMEAHGAALAKRLVPQQRQGDGEQRRGA